MKNINRKPNILDKQYKRLFNKLVVVSEERRVIYSEIITECIEHLGSVAFDEIKYRITDGSDINNVMLLMLSKLYCGGYNLKLKRDIDVFINEDWIYKYTNNKKH